MSPQLEKQQYSDIDWQCINAIRCLCIDMVQEANSGHPGMPLGMAPVAHVLFTRFLNWNVDQIEYPNRDRFVLSNGHGCALLYSMLHLANGQLSMDDLKKFRYVASKTPGHPEANHGSNLIEVTTGPLGQGISNAVGLAIAQKHLNAQKDTPYHGKLDHHIYVFASDGDLMEGVSNETGNLAGHLGLGNIIAIFDDNNVTIDGNTKIAYSEDVKKRYEAIGWHVLEVEDGNSDLKSIENAIEQAKNETEKPSMIVLKTTIGYASAVAGTNKAHGAPLGSEEVANVKKKFNRPTDKKFYVEQEVYDFYNKYLVERGREKAKQNPLPDFQAPNINYEQVKQDLMKACGEEQNPLATRKSSSAALNVLYKHCPTLIGGSADLAASNNTALKGDKEIQKGQYEGHTICFGVREHGMAAICNGIYAYNRHMIPFAATFLIFSTYMYGAVRLSALSKFKVLYVLTHDSIGLGEDGPTHMPIEVIPLYRATPNMYLFRPADGRETAACYYNALRIQNAPCAFSLTRQNVPQLEKSSMEGALRGAYTVYGDDIPDDQVELVFVGTGSEVSLCIDAAQKTGKKCRVISMPCQEVFEEQDSQYKNNLFLNGNVPVISVEASSTRGWERYSHIQLGMYTFGVSGAFKDVFNYFGFTPDNVANKANEVLEYFKKNNNRLGFLNFMSESKLY